MKNRLQIIKLGQFYIRRKRGLISWPKKKTDKMKKEPKIIESKEETPTKSCQLLPGGFAGTIICPKSSELYKILSN